MKMGGVDAIADSAEVVDLKSLGHGGNVKLVVEDVNVASVGWAIDESVAVPVVSALPDPAGCFVASVLFEVVRVLRRAMTGQVAIGMPFVLALGGICLGRNPRLCPAAAMAVAVRDLAARGAARIAVA